MLQQGERLHVRFDVAADAARARGAIATGWPDAAVELVSDTELAVPAAVVRGPDLLRRLASEDVFPAEVILRRQSLENVFIELTAERDVAMAADAEPAATAAGEGAAS
jgi:hypothetical protein